MMSVSRLLGRKGATVHTIPPDESVLVALRTMAERDIGALVVLEGGVVRGVISERDYSRKVILRGKTSVDTPVAEIMSTELVSVTPQETVEDCMDKMTERRVRHLPVLDDGELLGIISIGDVVAAIIEHQKHETEELEGYITGRR
ncbi:MAG: CBS domain-containing protein [Myxococcales bacterium]|nr:CBS domain-containing protein [Myxococcales bacterium]